MSLLRSSLFIAIVSLFVLTGYGFDLFGDCCGSEKQVQTQSGKTAPGKKAPGKSDDCQCICHQIISHSSVEPMRVAAVLIVTAEFVAHPDEFPPDAVPLGIDYPPQLA
ncbi:MAG: hypothetical protein ABJF10_30220 [Chthoniobacter sp.]|uniref:hypothetical protein n=1 Tax=Chthoniobacter sp. TaxID=2510640 RepID=UPI0032A94EFF